jgi:GTP-binding protein
VLRPNVAQIENPKRCVLFAAPHLDCSFDTAPIYRPFSLSLINTARFNTTVVQLEALFPPNLPEVAFVGRSNAGKSSTINTLCGRRQLAFASSMPGRTQALNIFELGFSGLSTGYLVDTPGYGYAKVSQSDKVNWDRLAGDYLVERTSLAGVILVCDIRRGLSELDLELLRWIPNTTPTLVLLTKTDKFNRQEQVKALKAAKELVVPGGTDRSVDLFSTPARIGIEATTAWLEAKYGDYAPKAARIVKKPKI